MFYNEVQPALATDPLQVEGYRVKGTVYIGICDPWLEQVKKIVEIKEVGVGSTKYWFVENCTIGSHQYECNNSSSLQYAWQGSS